jgi:hypothetical protein
VPTFSGACKGNHTIFLGLILTCELFILTLDGHNAIALNAASGPIRKNLWIMSFLIKTIFISASLADMRYVTD